MKVKVIKPFFGRLPDGTRFLGKIDDEFELPDGTDWLKAGFVEPVAEPKVMKRETATSKKAAGRSKRGTKTSN